MDGNHNNKKPEPTPGGIGMRPDLLEPPTEYKQQAATTPTTPSPLQSAKLQNEEYHQSPQTPATPGWMSKLQQDGQPTSPAVAKQQQVDNQVLSLLNGVGACYLILNSSNDNTTNTTSLNIYYSESPMQNAVGVWTAPDILDFKQVQNLSELEFIGNCASDCDINPIN
eukprot:scaffold933_cov64-Cylindrotheca_fusiformis.AAC.2